MAANTAPIYSSKGDIQWGSSALTSSNSNYDGSGNYVLTVSTAGSDGNFIQRMRYKASGSTVQAVSRIFIFRQSDNTYFLYDDVTLPSVTATPTSATTTIEVPMNFVLPNGYSIKSTISQNQPNGGWYVGTVGGSYTI